MVEGRHSSEAAHHCTCDRSWESFNAALQEEEGEEEEEGEGEGGGGVGGGEGGGW